MKAAARRIMDEAETGEPVAKVNALEAPAWLGPEIIPTTWTSEHIAKRIVEAFETLAKLPPVRGPKQPGNHWPAYVYEWADKLAQEELSEREKLARRRDRNAVRLNPTSEDLRRMDAVLGWLSDLARADAHLCVVVQRWARLLSIPGRSVKGECRRVGISHQAFYRLRDRGLALIVSRLASAPVW